MSSVERVEANLRALERPYLDPERLARIRQLFGRIQAQVR